MFTVHDIYWMKHRDFCIILQSEQFHYSLTANSGVAKIFVEEGRGRIFVVLYSLQAFLAGGGGSRCPFSIRKNRSFIFSYFYLLIINIFY